jgi:hypothetical protein
MAPRAGLYVARDERKLGQRTYIKYNSLKHTVKTTRVTVYYILPCLLRLHEVIIANIKVKLSLCVINKTPRHEDASGSGDTVPPFLTSVLDGGEWSASRSGHFISGGRASGTHWVGGWVGPRAGLDAADRKTMNTPVENRTPVVQPVAHRYTD